MNVGICCERVQMASADECSKRGTTAFPGRLDASIDLT
jgi:hypothetical protein